MRLFEARRKDKITKSFQGLSRRAWRAHGTSRKQGVLVAPGKLFFRGLTEEWRLREERVRLYRKASDEVS